jgi:putative addiction module CopG family antidote
MNVTLGPAAQRMIEERISTGAYASPEEVVTAALAALQRDEAAGDFDAGEMERLLDEGEHSGDALDAEQVFAELRDLRNRRAGNVG